MSIHNTVTAYVPTPGELRFTDEQFALYTIQQSVLKLAVERHGLEIGISVALSGLTRELRRHLTIEQVQQALRELADTIPDVARYDVKD